MRSVLQVLLADGALLVLGTPAFAGKVPLRPDELVAESQLIVVGKVQSHRDEQRVNDDGSVSKLVFLTVRVESVEKGAKFAMPGDLIQTGFWVVVKEPRRGTLWDSGHWGIPGDGGRAKFFLNSRSGDIWSVIYPNGFERLDDTPALQYRLVPAERFDWSVGVGLGIAGAAVVAALVWLIIARRNRRGAVPDRRGK